MNDIQFLINGQMKRLIDCRNDDERELWTLFFDKIMDEARDVRDEAILDDDLPNYEQLTRES